MQDKPKVIVIVGPTASGKTALSIELAKRIDGQIISADSMQIYKYMDIGTAKPTKEEKQGIKHYLMDFLEPNVRFSVAKYKELAEEAIEEILKNNKTPIIVGGTGLYINSLVDGIKFSNIKTDLEYREFLKQRAEKEGLEVLYNEVKQIDPIAAEKISVNDFKRISRVLEIYKATGKNITYQNEMSRAEEVKYDYIMFGISLDRQYLYDRINKRVDIMVENGLVQEVEEILSMYDEFPTAMQALGYKEVIPYLNGEVSKQDMIDKIKMESRRYAKRQLTWFRRDTRINWLNGGEKTLDSNINEILKIID